MTEKETASKQNLNTSVTLQKAGKPPVQKEGEQGGPAGPEPTRYGDWEKGGRCTDF